MHKKYLLGIDIGSSSVKTALLDIESGSPAAVAFSPASEMPMLSARPGFAEQEPEQWWRELVHAIQLLKQKHPFAGNEVAAIGISYQMHGLVALDRDMQPVRPSIIWCDSRAVDIGAKAFRDLGESFCLSRYLNSPGNFTASKLKWVKENEPEKFAKVHKVMLPGDYIAFRLTGRAATTVSGLSEGILWDYTQNDMAKDLLEYYGIDPSLLAERVDSFGDQGQLTRQAAETLGLEAGIPLSYRAGDQPNNAFSLNVLEPGEIAATAGTSGVVYGVTDKVEYDPASRVNTFVHVNHQPGKPRYGILLCINGTGILNSWLRANCFAGMSYPDINRKAEAVPIGAEGLLIYPFGNGAERVLENRNPGARVQNLQFNTHHQGHLARAAQEGIVYSLYYGITVMQAMGMQVGKVRAGYANMFLSDTFAEAFANTTGAVLELYDTDGATGAARAAGLGAGLYKSAVECFRGMKQIRIIEPEREKSARYREVYEQWSSQINQ